jgi:hypothetical protein
MTVFPSLVFYSSNSTSEEEETVNLSFSFDTSAARVKVRGLPFQATVHDIVEVPSTPDPYKSDLFYVNDICLLLLFWCQFFHGYGITRESINFGLTPALCIFFAVSFFKPPHPISLGTTPDGRPSGEAWVVFPGIFHIPCFPCRHVDPQIAAMMCGSDVSLVSFVSSTHMTLYLLPL